VVEKIFLKFSLLFPKKVPSWLVRAKTSRTLKTEYTFNRYIKKYEPSSPVAKAYTAFLIFYLVDDTLRTDEDIQQYLGLTILGDIPNANNANKKHYGYYSAYGGKRAKQAKKGG